MPWQSMSNLGSHLSAVINCRVDTKRQHNVMLDPLTVNHHTLNVNLRNKY